MRWRHSSPVPPRKMAPSTMVTAHKTAKRRTFPLSRDATAEWMVMLLESRQMVKNADSAAISEYMPTFPREGSRQSIAACSLVAFMRLSGSFVEPVGIFRVLEIPQRPAALHDRNGGEVVLGGRRGRGPLERPRVPGVAARARASEV